MSIEKITFNNYWNSKSYQSRSNLYRFLITIIIFLYIEIYIQTSIKFYKKKINKLFKFNLLNGSPDLINTFFKFVCRIWIENLKTSKESVN